MPRGSAHRGIITTAIEEDTKVENNEKAPEPSKTVGGGGGVRRRRKRKWLDWLILIIESNQLNSIIESAPEAVRSNIKSRTIISYGWCTSEFFTRQLVGGAWGSTLTLWHTSDRTFTVNGLHAKISSWAAYGSVSTSIEAIYNCN